MSSGDGGNGGWKTHWKSKGNNFYERLSCGGGGGGGAGGPFVIILEGNKGVILGGSGGLADAIHTRFDLGVVYGGGSGYRGVGEPSASLPGYVNSFDITAIGNIRVPATNGGVTGNSVTDGGYLDNNGYNAQASTRIRIGPIVKGVDSNGQKVKIKVYVPEAPKKGGIAHAQVYDYYSQGGEGQDGIKGRAALYVSSKLIIEKPILKG